jgi:protein SCO1/2
MIGAETSDAFAKHFHEDFVGISPEMEELAAVKEEFNIYLAESLTEEGAYDHTAFLFLLKRENGTYRLRYIYTHTPLDETMIAKNIKGL